MNDEELKEESSNIEESEESHSESDEVSFFLESIFNFSQFQFLTENIFQLHFVQADPYKPPFILLVNVIKGKVGFNCD